MIKKINNLKKNKLNSRAIDLSILERMKKPGYRYVNKCLTLDATAKEKSKHEICRDILRYTQENKISEQSLKKTLGIKQIELDYLLYCHIDKFTLDQLVDYASKLFAPFHLDIVPEKSLLFTSKNSRLRKSA